jgi:serine/threonine protein kinase
MFGLAWLPGYANVGAASTAGAGANSGMMSQTAHYQIVEEIGRGGMGVVFKARDARNGQTVALKLLSATLSDDSDAKERFQREARAASLLDHANICAILETGEHEGRPFLVMPFSEGPTLRQVLDSKTLGLDETLELAS